MAENTQEQCAYCKHWYPAPVSYHHTQQECEENIARQQKEMREKLSEIARLAEEIRKEATRLLEGSIDPGSGSHAAEIVVQMAGNLGACRAQQRYMELKFSTEA